MHLPPVSAVTASLQPLGWNLGGGADVFFHLVQRGLDGGSISLITRISRYKTLCPRAVPATDLACVTRHLTVVHHASRVTVAAEKGHWSGA